MDEHRKAPEATDAHGRLWTPWRQQYVQDPLSNDPGCPFCLGEGTDEALVIHRGSEAFVRLNAYPYTPGHLMVIPYEHTDRYEDLRTAQVWEMAELTQKGLQALKAAIGATAFNVGMNLGSVGGAGLPGHLHQHLVPRSPGDTNFMPVIGQTKVLNQVMEETRQLLSAAWAASTSPHSTVRGRRGPAP